MEKIKRLFADRSKRHIVVLILMIPFIVIMIFFGVRAYKDAKGILSLVKGDGTEIVVKDTHRISSMNYVLREGET